MTVVRTGKVARVIAALATAGALTGGILAFDASPAFAQGGALTDTSWVVSNNAANNGGLASNTATYSWTFTTATTAALTSATFSVPTGTSGSSLTPTVYGLGSDGATASLSGTTVTVTLTGGANIASGTVVQIAISGFTNGTGTGSQTSTITTADGSGTVDSGSATATFANNTTSVNVIVPESLTFTNNKPSITLTPVPGSPAVEGPDPGTLTVSTNAQGGYTLSACSGSLTGPGSNTISQAGSSPVSPLTGSEFGASAAVSGGSATLENGWTGSGYRGYAASCSGTSGDPSIVASDSGPTDLDTLTFTNAASVSATQAAGAYTGTINYLLTPSY